MYKLSFFYQFACGNFNPVIAEFQHTVTDYYSLVEQMLKDLDKILNQKSKPNELKPFKMTKKFYQSCKDRIENYTIKQTTELLKDLGGWPVVESYKWNERDSTWQRVFFKLATKVDPIYFIKLDVNVGLQDNSKNCLRVGENKIWSSDCLS